MQKIPKGAEPEEFSAWKLRHRGKSYQDLDGTEVRRQVRQACIQEQGALCAYCCCRIDLEKSHIDHVVPRAWEPNRDLDFDNMVAGCNGKKTCGHKKGRERLDITPLMPDCETAFQFKISGEVEGRTPAAEKTIKTLALTLLKMQRRAAINALLSAEGVSPNELETLDDETFGMLIEWMGSKDAGGALPSFAPVLRLILTQLLEAGRQRST